MHYAVHGQTAAEVIVDRAHFNLYTAALVIRRRSGAHLAFVRSEAEKRRDNRR